MLFPEAERDAVFVIHKNTVMLLLKICQKTSAPVRQKGDSCVLHIPSHQTAVSNSHYCSPEKQKPKTEHFQEYSFKCRVYRVCGKRKRGEISSIAEQPPVTPNKFQHRFTKYIHDLLPIFKSKFSI